MGLDIGVVKIEYLERPGEPIYDFLWRLAQDAQDEEWGGSWSGNAFAEIQQRRMLAKARAYAKEVGLTEAARDTLLAWVRALPWRRSWIMLHFNW